MLLESGPGEGDDDNVYMVLDMRCEGGALRQFEALYQRIDGRWVYRSETEADSAPLHETP